MNKSFSDLRIADMILYMESGTMLDTLLDQPFLPTFDMYMLKGIDVGTNDSGKGPFQMTNAFLKDYYPKGKAQPDRAIELIHLLAKENEKASNIPVYQIMTLIGFIDRFPEDKLEVIYDKYFMPFDHKPLFAKQLARVNNYIRDYYNEDIYFIS